MSLMGLDIGTTGTKATVFDEGGRILASAYREYPMDTPRPGWLELNPQRVWENVVQAVKEAATPCAADPVKALAVSCLGEAAIPLDAQGNILDNSIIGFDNRAGRMFDEWIADKDRERIMHITGQPPSQMFTVVKLMWIKQNRPEIYTKLKRFPTFEDFAYIRMGLAPKLDYSMAARTMAFDIHSHQYSDEIAGLCGVDTSVLSEAIPTGGVVGEIGPKASAELGLPVGCLVCAGAHDQPAGALGAGVILPEVAMDATGTVECFAASMEKPVVNKVMLQNNLPCYPHSAGGLYIALAFNFTGGSLFRWVRDELGAEERALAAKEGKDVYEVFTERMSRQPTDLFIVPHFTSTGTPYMDPDPVSAVIGLRLSTTRAELLRAVLEGITYEMKLNLSILESAGVHVKELRAIGGGAKSDFWLQLKADMFGRPVVRLTVTECAALGMAISAGVAAGTYGSVREAVQTLIKPDRVFEPNAKITKIYDEKLDAYRRIYPLLKTWQQGG